MFSQKTIQGKDRKPFINFISEKKRLKLGIVAS